MTNHAAARFLFMALNNSLFKLTYVLVKFGFYNRNVPIPCVGKSGRKYGHYQFEQNYLGMVCRLSQEDWEKGAGKDIVTKGGQMIQPVLFVEVEAAGSLGEMADESRALKLANETLVARLQDALQQFAVIAGEYCDSLDLRAKLDKVLSLPGAPTEAQLIDALQADRLEMQRIADEVRQAQESSDPLAQYDRLTQTEDVASIDARLASNPGPMPGASDSSDRAALEALPHRTLREMCQAHNASNPEKKIPLTNPRKEQMVEALLAVRVPA